MDLYNVHLITGIIAVTMCIGVIALASYCHYLLDQVALQKERWLSEKKHTKIWVDHTTGYRNFVLHTKQWQDYCAFMESANARAGAAWPDPVLETKDGEVLPPIDEAASEYKAMAAVISEAMRVSKERIERRTKQAVDAVTIPLPPPAATA